MCAGNDGIRSEKQKIQLTGGTAWEGLVCCNGQVYEDACAYALVKNESGRVKVYKENIYLRKDAVKHIVTKSDRVLIRFRKSTADGRKTFIQKNWGFRRKILRNRPW